MTPARYVQIIDALKQSREALSAAVAISDDYLAICPGDLVYARALLQKITDAKLTVELILSLEAKREAA